MQVNSDEHMFCVNRAIASCSFRHDQFTENIVGYKPDHSSIVLWGEQRSIQVLYLIF